MKCPKLIYSLLVSILCFLNADAFAKPSKAPSRSKITEIVLADSPGFVAPPYKLNKFVFYADGRAIWLTGTHEKPLRRIGHCYDFAMLAALFEEQKFFTLKLSYSRIADLPSTWIEAVRGGKRKSVAHNSGSGPFGRWTLEMAVRGVATTIDWQPPVAEKALQLNSTSDKTKRFPVDPTKQTSP